MTRPSSASPAAPGAHRERRQRRPPRSLSDRSARSEGPRDRHAPYRLVRFPLAAPQRPEIPLPLDDPLAQPLRPASRQARRTRRRPSPPPDPPHGSSPRAAPPPRPPPRRTARARPGPRSSKSQLFEPLRALQSPPRGTLARAASSPCVPWGCASTPGSTPHAALPARAPRTPPSTRSAPTCTAGRGRPDEDIPLACTAPAREPPPDPPTVAVCWPPLASRATTLPSIAPDRGDLRPGGGFPPGLSSCSDHPASSEIRRPTAKLAALAANPATSRGCPVRGGRFHRRSEDVCTGACSFSRTASRHCTRNSRQATSRP
jgi:hypothetical protein